MSITIFRNTSLSGLNGSYSTNSTLTAGSKTAINETVADAATDADIAFSFENAVASDAVQALALKSSQDVSVKIAQADNTVLDTIALTAGVPYVWTSGSGVSAPTWLNAGDVDKLRVTNASGANADLFADVLFDPTP